MSSIFAFEKFELKRLSRQTSPVEEGDAEIILFTGVQYERTEVGPPETDGPSLKEPPVSKRKHRSF